MALAARHHLALVEDCRAGAPGHRRGPPGRHDRRRRRVQLLSDQEPRRAGRRRRGHDRRRARWRRASSGCATAARPRATTTTRPAPTAASTRCRRRSCARACAPAGVDGAAARDRRALPAPGCRRAASRVPREFDAGHVYHLFPVLTTDATPCRRTCASGASRRSSTTRCRSRASRRWRRPSPAVCPVADRVCARVAVAADVSRALIGRRAVGGVVNASRRRRFEALAIGRTAGLLADARRIHRSAGSGYTESSGDYPCATPRLSPLHSLRRRRRVRAARRSRPSSSSSTRAGLARRDRACRCGTILAEWARLGGTKVVGAERIAGSPLTIHLEKSPKPRPSKSSCATSPATWPRRAARGPGRLDLRPHPGDGRPASAPAPRRATARRARRPAQPLPRSEPVHAMARSDSCRTPTATGSAEDDEPRRRTSRSSFRQNPPSVHVRRSRHSPARRFGQPAAFGRRCRQGRSLPCIRPDPNQGVSINPTPQQPAPCCSFQAWHAGARSREASASSGRPRRV